MVTLEPRTGLDIATAIREPIWTQKPDRWVPIADVLLEDVAEPIPEIPRTAPARRLANYGRAPSVEIENSRMEVSGAAADYPPFVIDWKGAADGD